MKLKVNKGFTLIEILIAMSITSIIILTLFTTLNSTIKGNVKNEINIKTLNLGQSEIENIRELIKEEKEIKIVDDLNNQSKNIAIGSNALNILNKKIKNDNRNYYEKIYITKEKITYGNNSNYLYTIKVIVNDDIQKLNNNQGKEIITKVFSKKSY